MPTVGGLHTTGRKALLSSVAAFLATAILAVFLTGCAQKFPIREAIVSYLYEHQPTTGSQFVQWAKENLSDFTPLEIQRALEDEAKNQAELGHPNVIGVMSYSAEAWATEYDLTYNPNYWVELQQEAMGNMRQPGTLQLWP